MGRVLNINDWRNPKARLVAVEVERKQNKLQLSIFSCSVPESKPGCRTNSLDANRLPIYDIKMRCNLNSSQSIIY